MYKCVICAKPMAQKSREIKIENLKSDMVCEECLEIIGGLEKDVYTCEHFQSVVSTTTLIANIDASLYTDFHVDLYNIASKFLAKPSDSIITLN